MIYQVRETDLQEEQRLYTDLLINRQAMYSVAGRIKGFYELAEYKRMGDSITSFDGGSQVFDLQGKIVAQVNDSSGLERERSFLFGYKNGILVATARIISYSKDWNIPPSITYRLGDENEGWTNYGKVRNMVMPLLPQPPSKHHRR